MVHSVITASATVMKMIAQVSFFIICLFLAGANGYFDPHLAHHDFHHAKPYSFGYTNKDHHGEQHRHETGDGKNVKGSYGFKDARGIYREVNYVADHGGFRAEIKTNEPGTAPHDSAHVKMMSSAHPYFGAGHGFHDHGPKWHGTHFAGHKVASLLGHGYKVDWDGHKYGINGGPGFGYGYGGF